MHPVGFIASAAAGGLTMAGSITFNGSNEHLSISSFSSSSPNQKTMSFSLWVKPASVDDIATLLGFRADNSNLGVIFLDASDISINGYNEQSGSTTLFEYKANTYAIAWQHYLIAIDTRLSTSADRCRLYRNGSLITGTTANETPAQNSDLYFFTNSAPLGIGANPAPSEYFEGQLADIVAVEGQALTPSDFGYDNGGTWSWKNYTGSFGTHGFRVNPQNSGDIGTDQSGNGNTFTLNNMDSSNFDSGDLPPG
jgi:hypothetical protein